MARIHRHFYLILVVVVLVLLFNATWSPRRRKAPASHADARLLNFLDSVAPLKEPFRPDRAYDPPERAIIQKQKPRSTINLFPLGLGTKTRPMPARTPAPRRPAPAGHMFHPPAPGGRRQPPHSVDLTPEEAKQEVLGIAGSPPSLGGKQPSSRQDEEEQKRFDDQVYEFQRDITVPDLSAHLKPYAKHRAHNWNAEEGHPAFATYFCSTDSSLRDPYFAAVQNLVYRNLWANSSRSEKHPFIVYVAPFISKEQRDILSGAGALVRELPLVKWDPPVKEEVFGRWSHLFSKLHLWNQRRYSRIAFMDVDAFPVRNIDDIFDLAEPRQCNRTAFAADADDAADEWADSCDYTFAAVKVLASEQFNVGMMVLQPDAKMHARLLRNYRRYDMYDNKLAEQGFLNWQFNLSSPFPYQSLPREYNGFFPQAGEEAALKVVHEKIWTVKWDLAPWLRAVWADSWKDMEAWYASDAFKQARRADHQPALEAEREQARTNRMGIEGRFRESKQWRPESGERQPGLQAKDGDGQQPQAKDGDGQQQTSGAEQRTDQQTERSSQQQQQQQQGQDPREETQLDTPPPLQTDQTDPQQQLRQKLAQAQRDEAPLATERAQGSRPGSGSGQAETDTHTESETRGEQPRRRQDAAAQDDARLRVRPREV